MQAKGFIKVCAITPELLVGNPNYNVSIMLELLKNNKASYAVFPEMSVTGYTCADLFYSNLLLNDVNKEIARFLKENCYKGIVLIGAPLEIDGSLYNCAFVIKEHQILGIVPKRSLPNSKEFYEKRWFKSALYNHMDSVYFNGEMVPFGNLIFDDFENNIHFGVEICEDMWAPIAPSNMLSYHGANLFFNLSGSNETLGKSQIRRTTVLENSRRNCGAYVYASAGVNESTSETVYSGHNIIASCGTLIKETENFSEKSEIIYADIDMNSINFKRRLNTNFHDLIEFNINYKHISFHLLNDDEYEFENKIDETPFIPKGTNEEILDAFYKVASVQEYALLKRMKHTNAKKIVIGISGGLDSTLALLIAVETLRHMNRPLTDIVAVTMPGFATTSRTKDNATKMMEALGVTMFEKPIALECQIHFKTIEQDPLNHDITYENTQARIRTLILMNLANKLNGIVLGTGDLSELALGWCTYNGDQMSMYGINAGVPKTLVRFMIKYYALTKHNQIKDILFDIIDTPISPELSDKNQKTEDFIGKYEVNDYILYRFLACGDDENRISYLVSKAFNYSLEEANTATNNFFKRFYTAQFKRQALPDGPKVLDISLSPRSDWRMPSDVKR